MSKMMILIGSVIIGIGISTGIQLATGEVDAILIESEYLDAVEYSTKLKNEIDTLKKSESDLIL
ncbi:MAG TPA: hypothetical protein VLM88_10515, partial [Proteiniclasticum sp.]|nr:hypothetical protein [Proteiniclasticum sp.]